VQRDLWMGAPKVVHRPRFALRLALAPIRDLPIGDFYPTMALDSAGVHSGGASLPLGRIDRTAGAALSLDTPREEGAHPPT
jgi:hypothetical protein